MCTDITEPLGIYNTIRGVLLAVHNTFGTSVKFNSTSDFQYLDIHVSESYYVINWLYLYFTHLTSAQSYIEYISSLDVNE